MEVIKTGIFYIDGKESDTAFSAHLTEYPNIPKPKRKFVQSSVCGGSQDVFSDEQAYENREFELKIATTPRTHDEYSMTDISLFSAFDSNKYLEFSYYGEPDFTYFVKSTDSVEIERVTRVSDVRISTFKITAGAFKYFHYHEVIELTEPSYLVNPYPYISLPYLKIVGSGDVSLTINKKVYNFTGIDQYIEVDCDTLQQDVFKGDEPMNEHFVGNELPYLDKDGKNDISWTGNVSKVIIEPRWRAI